MSVVVWDILRGFVMGLRSNSALLLDSLLKVWFPLACHFVFCFIVTYLVELHVVIRMTFCIAQKRTSPVHYFVNVGVETPFIDS